ncbi:MAG: 2,5-diamino-6-(ribosylamino)-4(3H)-pyrimidinone 5'-phosphate reductase [Methanobacteriaceae archaeon]
MALKKPYVILNAAMTLDGKIATKTSSSEISGPDDLIRVHKLRAEVDGIMVGIGTVLADNPRLTVHKIDVNNLENIKDASNINPVRVIVDSNLRTPFNFRVLNKDAKTIVAISGNTANNTSHNMNNITNNNKHNNKSNNTPKTKNSEKIDKLQEVKNLENCEIFASGEKQVDLKLLMNYLYEEGIETLMLEGGSTLNFSMLELGLINEIKLCVAPKIIGGKDAKTLFDGNGIDYMKDGVNLKLKNSYTLGKDLILEYDILQ